MSVLTAFILAQNIMQQQRLTCICQLIGVARDAFLDIGLDVC